MRTLLAELDGIGGRGTELITVYIPQGKQLHEVVSMLREERGTADNIKSDTTRKHVTDSLSKVVQRLSMLGKTPENGIAMFCGMILREGDAPGSERMAFHEIFPPRPLKQYLYRCDSMFHTGILRSMLKPDKTIGFLALDAKDAGWGILRGDGLEILDQTSSGVPGKHRQGGQSAKRFQKLREMHLSDYYARVAETTRRHFLDECAVDGIIISGPGHTKDEFAASKRLEYRLRDRVLGCVDGSYAGPEGVREAFQKSGRLLAGVRAVQERELVEKLFSMMNSKPGTVEYGIEGVRRRIADGSAVTVLAADDAGLRTIRVSCGNCGDSERTVRQHEVSAARTCGSCGAQVSLTDADAIDMLATECGKHGTAMEVVSGHSEHGMMLHSLGGVAAMLRYEPR